MRCVYFTDIKHPRCAAGVSYLTLAGGGVFTMVLRLPCLPITDRKGYDVQVCEKFKKLRGAKG